jgi:hypothetical protein
MTATRAAARQGDRFDVGLGVAVIFCACLGDALVFSSASPYLGEAYENSLFIDLGHLQEI